MHYGSTVFDRIVFSGHVNPCLKKNYILHKCVAGFSAIDELLVLFLQTDSFVTHA